MDDLASKLAFLEKIFGKAKYYPNTHQAFFYSPFCKHRKPKLTINLENDSWNCWISGEAGRKLFFPIKEAGGSKEDIKAYINKHKAKNVKVSDPKQYDFFEMQLPEGFTPLANCKDSLLGKRAYGYLKGRGITDLDVLRHKVGVLAEPDSLVFPSFSKEGRLNFYTLRTYKGRYIPASAPQGYRSTIIFNELNIDWKKPIVITEGFVDMLKSVRNTIPLFGSLVSEESLLFEKVVLNDTEVVLALDPDAWRKSEDLAKKLAKYDVSVYTVDLGNYEDLGATPKQEFLKMYENRTAWTPEDSFLKKLRALC